MAGFVLKDAHLTINATDQSAYIKDISFPLTAATVDTTTMGDDSLEYLLGLKDASFTVTFAQDSADAGLNEDIWDIYDGGVAVTFELKPNGSATSATNPEFTGSCLLTSWDPINGSVGDHATAPCTFQVTGDVTRSES